jgi:hypothetical protein
MTEPRLARARVDPAQKARGERRARRRRDIRRRRLTLAGGAAIPVIAVIVALSSAGSSPRPRTAPRSATALSAGAVTKVRVATLGTLPAPVQFPAAAPVGGDRIVLLGGLDASGSSTAAITTLSGGRAVSSGQLPAAQHDAQAATLGAEVYVFGGGGLQSYDHILRFDPASGQVTQVGRLPQPASDVAVAAVGDTAYVVGGYNGVDALDTIVAWRPGGTAQVVAHLPVHCATPQRRPWEGE